MIGRPETTEAAPYYFTYINQVTGDDPLSTLESQLPESLKFFLTISDEKSLHRYAPDKWSIRQVLSHVSDAERCFAFRALWFARGFDTPLPSFDQIIAVSGAQADNYTWATHIEDFRRVRLATLSFFASLAPEAWMRRGIASDNPFTVRSLAFICAGHLAHDIRILRERYF
jgi:DinB family protein